MKNWYVRPVFFVKDAQKSLEFYRDTLGFTVDWNHEENGAAFVCQVTRHGFELILNQDEARAGRGRAFISLTEPQEAELRRYIAERGIAASDRQWGLTVIEILDLDQNELFFSTP
ncbi:MAG: glyoxalase superfamily protein [Armatimonas sp.]